MTIVIVFLVLMFIVLTLLVKKRRSTRKRRRITAERLGVETKFLDCAWNSVTINTSTDGSGGEMQPSSGCTNALSVPAQGDTEATRDGKTYTVNSVWLSGVVNTTGLSDQADVFEEEGIFIALVLDSQTNAGTVVSENVYDNPSTDPSSMLPQPLRNLEYSTRYKILDRIYIPAGNMYAMTDHATNSSTASISAQNAKAFNLNWKGNMKVTCTKAGTTANVSSVIDNAIHLVGYSGGGLVKTFSGKSRLRFVG